MAVDTVVGASRREQLVTDAPSSVSIVTSDDIATFGWRTLADVLKSVRGLYVTNDRNYSYLGVQGFGRPTDYNNRVLFLVDGHRVNDNVYDGTLIGTEFPVDVDLIERIEIIRGPGSALYGTSAFFAVVNVITRRGAAIKGVEGSVDVGSQDLFRARATYGNAAGAGRQYLLSATRYSSAGMSSLYYSEFDESTTAFGVSRNNDSDAASSVYGSLNAGRTTLQGLFSRRAKRVPTGSWWTNFNDPRTRTVDSRAWFDVTHQFRAANTNFNARAAYDRMSYAATYPYDATENVQRDFAQGDWLTAELTGERSLHRRVRLVGGTEYRNHVNQDQWAYYASEPEVMDVEARHTSWQYAAFAQADVTVARNMTVIAGARYDWWTSLAGTVRPRLGVILHPFADASVKLLHGGAFRAPSVYERFYFEGQAALPALKPENLEMTEAIYEQYVGRRLRLTATTFYTHIDDLVSQIDAGDEVAYTNADHVHSKGGALEAEVRWQSGVLLRGGYSLQNVHSRESGLALSNAPRHLLTVNTSSPFLRRRGVAGLDLTRVSARTTNQDTRLDGAWLANVTVNYRLAGSRLALAGSINNLFDADYAHPVGGEFRQAAIQQNGRTFALRTTLRF